MDGSKKRRVAGVAAFSATAIASLLGAQPASAAPPAQPPTGLAQACQSRPAPDSPETLAFKQGFPAKWQGLRCSDAPEDAGYDWWQKIGTS